MLKYEHPSAWSNLTIIKQLEMQKTDDLVEALLVSLETGGITPLVKEELKYTIQSRRLAHGQEEIHVDFNNPGPSELREDEKEKIIRRKEQNKLAARRFRQRRRTKRLDLMKKIQLLEDDSKQKMSELRSLKKEKNELQIMLHNHLLVCPLANINTG